MPLIVFLLAIAPVSIFSAIGVGFWLGRGYCVPAPSNREDDSSRASEIQTLLDELSRLAANEASIAQRDPPPQPYRVGSLSRKTCRGRQGHDR